MEEKQTIQVELFDEPYFLNRDDFLDFNQLITKQLFAQIKIPFSSLNNSKFQVLNIFVYYIITIQKNFKPFQDDVYGDKYKSLCTKEISDYYIKNKFVIEEYQFSFLSSKALGIKLQESAHIIYYLVYGRFASHPYINSLCGRKDQDFKKNTFKKGKQAIQNLRILKKRTLNNQKLQNDMQLQNLKKDLQKALSSQQNHIICKKKTLNTWKQTKTLQQEDTQSYDSTERKNSSRGFSLNTFIPQRIQQGQNSSIFETLPFQKMSYQTCTDRKRKGLMRKQKFNQFFDINHFKIKNKLKKPPSSYFEDKKQNKTINTFIFSNSDQIGKINYENFRNISNNLKLKNNTLDKIRAQCSMRNHKPNQDKQKIESQVQNSIKLAQSTKGNQAEAKFLKVQQELQELNLEKLGLRRNFSSIDGNFLKELNLNKNFTYAPQRNSSLAIAEEQIEKVQDFTINLLRNDQSEKDKQNQEGKKLDYFSKTSAGFKEINCKYKLQRYKSDYRKFLKTQLLDRIKKAS